MKSTKRTALSSRARPSVFAAVVIAAAATLSSCGGVPVDSAAHPLSAAQFTPSSTSTTTTTIPSSSTQTQQGYEVYFILHGQLSPVARTDPSTTTPVSAPIAVASLDDGPNAEELVQGYTSAFSLAPGAEVLIGGIQNGVVTVSLNASFVNLLIGQGLPEAYGQIVLTLTSSSFANIKSVQFAFESSHIAALLPNGGIQFVVGRCAYAAIASASVKAQCARHHR